MSYMFAYSGVTNFDLREFDTSRVTTMHMMFGNNPNLTELDISTFNLLQVEALSQLVSYDSNLIKIKMPLLSSTPKLKSTYRMLIGNSSLKEIDLSMIDTSNETDMSEMLSGLSNLSTITLGNNFRSNATTGLPLISADGYSGYWKYNGDDTTVGTSDEFMENYNGEKPGTYVWEVGTDPLNPNDSTQQKLILKTVPSNYSFNSPLSNTNEYSLSNTLTTNNKLTVFNNRLDRDWYVQSVFVDKKILLSRDSNISLPVSVFKINTNDILATGATGRILESEATKTLSNNVGEISKAVSSTNISFSDSDTKLKVGDVLTGIVRYQLYNVARAN